MYSWENTCVEANTELASCVFKTPAGGSEGRSRRRKRKKDLEEEVEAKQSAAGDDGEPGGVATRDGLWHVRPVLERGDRGRDAGEDREG